MKRLCDGRLEVHDDGSLWIRAPGGKLLPLRDKQKLVLLAIADGCIETGGASPTMRDIATTTGISSTAVKYHIDALTRFGLLIGTGDGKGRSYVLRGAKWRAPDWMDAIVAEALVAGAES